MKSDYEILNISNTSRCITCKNEIYSKELSLSNSDQEKLCSKCLKLSKKIDSIEISIKKLSKNLLNKCLDEIREISKLRDEIITYLNGIKRILHSDSNRNSNNLLDIYKCCNEVNVLGENEKSIEMVSEFNKHIQELEKMLVNRKKFELSRQFTDIFPFEQKEFPSCLKIEEFEGYKILPRFESDIIYEIFDLYIKYERNTKSFVALSQTFNQFCPFVETLWTKIQGLLVIDRNDQVLKNKFDLVTNELKKKNLTGNFIECISNILNIEIFLKDKKYYSVNHYQRENYLVKLFIYKNGENYSILYPKKASYRNLQWTDDKFISSKLHPSSKNCVTNSYKQSLTIPAEFEIIDFY